MLQNSGVKIVKEFSKVKRNWRITIDSMQCFKQMIVTKFTSMKAFKNRICSSIFKCKICECEAKGKKKLKLIQRQNIKHERESFNSIVFSYTG